VVEQRMAGENRITHIHKRNPDPVSLYQPKFHIRKCIWYSRTEWTGFIHM